jgi:type II secretory pathway pseudopilin PulG
MRAGEPHRRRAAGFTYLGALFLLALTGLGLAGAGEAWSLASRRARERELLWVGGQYVRALQSYLEQSPGRLEYPRTVEDLVEDRRFPVPRHHLRQPYLDPVTRAPFVPIRTREGRIGGVRSASDEAPLKQAGFPRRWQEFQGRVRYSDWLFVADERLSSAPRAPASAPGP